MEYFCTLSKILWIFSQNFIFANFSCEDFRCRLVCSSWDSICEPPWSQIDVSTTCRYGMTQFLCATTYELGVTYISNTLSNKTILFDILDFWCQLVVIRFEKTLSNVACSFHPWKFQRVDYYTAWSHSTKSVEKRDLPKHGQTCGHCFPDVIWRIPNPTLKKKPSVADSKIQFKQLTNQKKSKYIINLGKETTTPSWARSSETYELRAAAPFVLAVTCFILHQDLTPSLALTQHNTLACNHTSLPPPSVLPPSPHPYLPTHHILQMYWP